MRNQVTLPQDVWFLVIKETSDRRDFVSLYNCALVNRLFANIALRQLYNIHDQSPAMTSDTVVYDASMPIRLWRSIICSALGATLFPYALWIKSLRLGNLAELLEGLSKDINKIHLTKFFEAPLQDFQILKTAPRVTRRFQGNLLDIDKIIIEVTSKIAEFVKSSAHEENKTVGLSSLEGYHLPTAALSSWLGNMSQLVSLTVRDGSVLDANVGKAIAENCPAFKEVICYFSRGADVDEDLAGFLTNLRPNSLESFTISSMNQVSQYSLEALPKHAESLKSLTLMSLERTAFEHLDSLSECTNIEQLSLEASSILASFEWHATYPVPFEGVHQWLVNCTKLRSLQMTMIPDATLLLGDVLKDPRVQLTSLSLKLLDNKPSFYTSLGSQIKLQSLSVNNAEEDLGLDAAEPRHVQFIQSICNCTELRDLRLLNESLSFQDIEMISQSLSQLEELTFDGEVADDFLPLLARLPKLKLLTVIAYSLFTFGGLYSFIHDLGHSEKASHYGINIFLGNQVGTSLSEEEEAMLQKEVAKCYNGKFEIEHRQDPDELHESDFSD